MTKKKIFIILFLIICFYLLSIQLVSIAKAEVLTSLYGKEFNGILFNGKKFDGIENGMIAKIDYLKILDYSYDKATLYYVNRNGSGNVCTYVKNQEDCWVETKWRTVWSSTGNDSDMIWPYWWDTILCRGAF